MMVSEGRSRPGVLIVIAWCAVVLGCVSTAADEDQQMAPGGQWAVHSHERPQPEKVDPGPGVDENGPVAPPSDAMVLFDGQDLSAWTGAGADKEPTWEINDGYMEIAADSGGIISKRSFGDSQIHLEFRTPPDDTDRGQGRGNSGVFLTGHCEIQVLDSYENDTYPDGQCAAIYGRFPPMVNASREPGRWQSYDIMFRSPRRENGEIVQPAAVTVLHNGMLVHHAAPTGGTGEKFRLRLQDHNNRVRYRNIWVRPVEGYDKK